MSKKLTDLNIGDSGLIESIELPSGLRKKLMEMGLTIGTKLLLKQAAPLGDPLWLEVRGYDLILRKSEAVHIMLKPLHQDAE